MAQKLVKYTVRVETGLVGSRVEDTIELPDDLSENEVEEACREQMFEMIEWGYEKAD